MKEKNKKRLLALIICVAIMACGLNVSAYDSLLFLN